MADTAVETTAAAEVTAKVGFIEGFFFFFFGCVKMFQEVLTPQNSLE